MKIPVNRYKCPESCLERDELSGKEVILEHNEKIHLGTLSVIDQQYRFLCGRPADMNDGYCHKELDIVYIEIEHNEILDKAFGRKQ